MCPSIGELLTSGSARLAALTETPRLDAEVTLAHVLRQPRTWILAQQDSPPETGEAARYDQLLCRLEDGEPLPYVLGHQEFFGLDFDLSPEVLIPRPETELLVRRALDWIGAAADRRTIADVGTGSGCIAVSIAVHAPSVKVLATDVSAPALQVARANAHKLGVANRIRFVECDLLPPHTLGMASEDHVDLICANLPYIPTGVLRSLPIFGREPSLALDGGTDGLDPFRRFFAVAPEWMAPGGLMLLEIEARSGPAVLSLAYDALHAAAIHLHKDLAGRDRLLEIQINGHA